MKKKKLREFCKTALIYLLIAAALAQTVMLWDAFLAGSSEGTIIERFFGEEMPVYAGQPVYEQISYASDLIRPLTAAVRAPGEGGLYVTQTPEEAAAVYERAALALTQALESAQTASLVTSAQWQEALDATMLLWDFGGRVRLSMLAYLLGAGVQEGLDGELRWLAAASMEGEVVLLYKSEERGIYVMPTGIASGSLEGLCRQYAGNGGWFGYERGLAQARDVMLVRQDTEYPVIRGYLASAGMDDGEFDRMCAAVLEGFGFNAYTVGSYTESDGSQVYVESERVLRMTQDGRVSYTDMSAMISAGEPDAQTRAARIGEVSRLAAQVLEPWLGDAEVYLLSAEVAEASGDFVVELGLRIGSEKVVTPQGFVLRAAYRGSRLMEADMEMKRYEYTGARVKLMNAVQAMAACGGKAGFGVYYVVEEGKEITPQWYASR